MFIVSQLEINLKLKKMKYLTLFVLLISSLSQAQRTLVAPVNPPRIFPQWVGGDRDFWGHGPRVTGAVRIQVTEGKGQIIAFINLRLEETEGDASAAEINETRLIYSAPAGKQIRLVTFPASMTSNFNFKLPRGGVNRVSATESAGPVNYLLINGDGESKDIGNNTNDDSHVSVIFKGFVVELEAIPTEIKEVSIGKSLITAMVQSKLNGTKGKLNTYGPRNGDSWFKPRDSWIKFPNGIRTDTMFFDQLREVLISPRRYNYNDINLTNIQGRVNGQYLQMSVNWESNGPEFRGECVNDVGCMFGSPTVQLDNFSIKLDLRPFVSGGMLTYDHFDVQVGFNYNYSADCGVLSALCTEIFKDPVQNAFFSAKFTLANVMGEATTRTQISQALTSGVLEFVRSFGRFPQATQLVEVLDSGNNLLIRCR